MNEVNPFRILEDVIDRRLTIRLSVTWLEISDRYCCRYLNKVASFDATL